MATTMLSGEVVLLYAVVLRKALQAMREAHHFSPPANAELLVKLALQLMLTRDEDFVKMAPAGAQGQEHKEGVIKDEAKRGYIGGARRAS